MSNMTGENIFIEPEGKLNETAGSSSTIALEIRQNTNDSAPPGLDAPDLEAAPDGGAQAWIVAAGAGAVFYCCLGLSNSFGAFEEFYLANQLRGESPDKISWIGSLSAFLQFAMGMVGGPMFDRYGARVCTSAWLVLL